MSRRLVIALAAALLLCAVAVPQVRAQQGHIGPDYVSSANLELIDRIKLVGDGVGATVVGKYMYVTSTKSLDIFDIDTDPEHPRQVGLETLDVEFENEEVPTNGKILGISGEIGCINLDLSHDQAGNCLTIYDVSDPAHVKYLTTVEHLHVRLSVHVVLGQLRHADRRARPRAREAGR
jgi:hypothetical protein